jgi:hypothetical protein
MATTPAQDARIRELLLVNLFAVFSEHDPERRLRAELAGGQGLTARVAM